MCRKPDTVARNTENFYSGNKSLNACRVYQHPEKICKLKISNYKSVTGIIWVHLTYLGPMLARVQKQCPSCYRQCLSAALQSRVLHPHNLTLCPLGQWKSNQKAGGYFIILGSEGVIAVLCSWRSRVTKILARQLSWEWTRHDPKPYGGKDYFSWNMKEIHESGEAEFTYFSRLGCPWISTCNKTDVLSS